MQRLAYCMGVYMEGGWGWQQRAEDQVLAAIATRMVEDNTEAIF